MITGVMAVLLGEALLFGAWPLAIWAGLFFLANAIYPPLQEAETDQAFWEELSGLYQACTALGPPLETLASRVEPAMRNSPRRVSQHDNAEFDKDEKRSAPNTPHPLAVSHIWHGYSSDHNRSYVR